MLTHRVRWVFWLLVLAQVLAPLDNALHHARIEHHYCAEHGANEHGADEHRADAHRSGDRGTAAGGADVAACAETLTLADESTSPVHPLGNDEPKNPHERQPNRDRDSHERCGQPITPYLASDPTTSPRIHDLGLVAPPLERVVTRLLPATIPLLRLAPKTPPPDLA